jgi:hypothetical protein
LWARELNAKDIHKEMLSTYGGKRFTTVGVKSFADDEEVETEMRKLLKQQSKEFYNVGFDAMVNRWDMCINVGGGYVEK